MSEGGKNDLGHLGKMMEPDQPLTPLSAPPTDEAAATDTDRPRDRRHPDKWWFHITSPAPLAGRADARTVSFCAGPPPPTPFSHLPRVGLVFRLFQLLS